MPKTNPVQYIQEVRQEAAKVTWPSRKETGVSTIMVFVMVFIAAIFFLVIDQILQLGIRFVFGLGG